MQISGTILIADDEPNLREPVASALAGHGFRLLFAANGKEALRMPIEHIPDLVLLFILMPKMDGFDVRRRLSSQN